MFGHFSWCIDGHPVRHGSLALGDYLTLFYGPSTAGKTFLIIDLIFAQEP